MHHGCTHVVRHLEENKLSVNTRETIKTACLRTNTEFRSFVSDDKNIFDIAHLPEHFVFGFGPQIEFAVFEMHFLIVSAHDHMFDEQASQHDNCLHSLVVQSELKRKRGESFEHFCPLVTPKTLKIEATQANT